MPPVRVTYEQLAHDLQARIKAGEYPPGTMLPSYKDLARIYSVSVSTVSRAMSLLRVLEVVRGQHGVGVFVADR